MSKQRHRGRGIDHTWKILKFRGDAALYPYCPKCGAKKKWYTDVERIDKEMWEYMRWK